MKNFILKRIYLLANRFDGKRAQNVRVWCIEMLMKKVPSSSAVLDAKRQQQQQEN